MALRLPGLRFGATPDPDYGLMLLLPGGALLTRPTVWRDTLSGLRLVLLLPGGASLTRPTVRCDTLSGLRFGAVVAGWRFAYPAYGSALRLIRITVWCCCCRVALCLPGLRFGATPYPDYGLVLLLPGGASLTRPTDRRDTLSGLRCGAAVAGWRFAYPAYGSVRHLIRITVWCCCCRVALCLPGLRFGATPYPDYGVVLLLPGGASLTRPTVRRYT
ncbi:hypothetical protein [Citrobacter sp. NCU1]|uniref:hypothetical protein n=1 Tax=Citrobacter sp. NCU1 TaxID=2026683 RepID=UPI001391E4D4|nr:hypothetical protein [Citrobacter sp. NCU1]